MEGTLTGVNGRRRQREDRQAKDFSVLPRDMTRVTIAFLGFFIGRTVVFGTLNPLATAYLAIFCGEGLGFYATAACIALGYFTKLTGFYQTKYLTGLAILCLFQFLIRRSVRGRRFWLKEYRPRGENGAVTKPLGAKVHIGLQCAAAGASLFLAGLITLILNGFGAYFAILCLLESFLAACLTFVMKKGIQVLTTNRRRKLLGNEEMIGIAILSGAVIAGAAQIYIGSVSLKYFFSFLVILLAGYKGGSAFGAQAGMVLGLVLHISGYITIETLVVYSLSGACAGAARDWGKLGAMGALAAGILAGAYLLDRSLLGIELLLSVAAAALLFLALPDYFYFNIGAAMDPADNTDEYLSRMKELTAQRLQGFSGSFSKLAKIFGGLAEKKPGLNQKDIAKLIDDVAAETCTHCEINRHCWENDFYNTYQAIFGMLGDCERKGGVEEEDWPEFAKTCVHFHAFLKNMNQYFSLYKTNLVWHNRIAESRELVRQQLMGVSGIIGRLAEELDFELVFKEDLEEKLRAELLKNKIEVDKLIVLENKEGKYEVTFRHKACYGKNRHEQILEVVNRMLGRKMKRSDKYCEIDGKTNTCRVRLIEEQKYRLTVGMARQAKQGDQDSGDTYSFMELKNGQCLLALSDGMGSGKRAREESNATIELLEDFIDSGFDKELAVKMINSVLILKSSEESFSTLDICSVDLYTGEGEFIKIGAASTFLLRGSQIQVIRSSSLPIGILNTVDLEISLKKLRDNDMIVMVTDGLLETGTDTDGEAWLSEVMQSFPCANPQDLADHVLEAAKSACGGEPRDDMTVLAAKIWRKV